VGGKARLGDGGCMLWLFGRGALVGGDGCVCDLCTGALVSPPPPIIDEMDMLLPGRCIGPRPGSSLCAPKLDA
jgi:hypothetical protein